MFLHKRFLTDQGEDYDFISWFRRRIALRRQCLLFASMTNSNSPDMGFHSIKSYLQLF